MLIKRNNHSWGFSRDVKLRKIIGIYMWQVNKKGRPEKAVKESQAAFRAILVRTADKSLCIALSALGSWVFFQDDCKNVSISTIKICIQLHVIDLDALCLIWDPCAKNFRARSCLHQDSSLHVKKLRLHLSLDMRIIF